MQAGGRLRRMVSPLLLELAHVSTHSAIPTRLSATLTRLSLTLAATLATHPAWAQTSPSAALSSPPTACANVQVSNLRTGQGVLRVADYASAASYMKAPVAVLQVPVGEATTLRFELCGLTGTEVALALFQDLNSDGQMGRNLMGMPSEPWGASGTPGMMVPTWASTRVALDGSLISLSLSQ